MIVHVINIVGNRSEIRYANGLRPLIELLVSEHLEIQDFGLKCLTKCQEDCI